jgi:hypothetical protein
MHEGKQKARARLFVFRLKDHCSPRPIRKLQPNFRVLEMVLAHHRKQSFWRNQPFGPLEGVLQHRALSDKIDILLGKIVPPQLANKRLEALPFPGSQDNPTTIRWTVYTVHGISPLLHRSHSSYLSKIMLVVNNREEENSLFNSMRCDFFQF